MNGEKFPCKSCNGKGLVETKSKGSKSLQSTCYDCDGTGYVDWIENIVGKKQVELLTPEWQDKIIKEFCNHMVTEIDKQILEEYFYGYGRRKIPMQKMQRNWPPEGRSMRKMQGIRIPRLDRQHHRKK